VNPDTHLTAELLRAFGCYSRRMRYFTIRTRDGRVLKNNATDHEGTTLEAMRYLWRLYVRAVERSADAGWMPVSMTYQPKGKE